MTDEEKISAIKEIVAKLRNDKETGLNRLSNFVMTELLSQTTKAGSLHEFILKCAKSRREEKKLAIEDERKIDDIKARINMFVIKKIHEYEDDQTKKIEDFQKDIRDTIIQHLKDYDDPQKDKTANIFNQSLAEYNNMREALNDKPYLFTKYGISTSCANAAAAFAYEFKNKYKDPGIEICFLDTTRWSNLINGKVGHVVPCVKLNEYKWLMVEPLHENVDNKVFQEISAQNFDIGESLEHLIDHHKDEPYMIVNISDTLPTDHEAFLRECSRVKVEDAIKFLSKVEKEGRWSPKMQKIIKRELEILSNLSEEEKKLEDDQPKGTRILQSIIEQRRQEQSMLSVTKNAQQSPRQNLEETPQKIRREYETISQKQLSSWETGIKRIKQKINSINLRDMFAFSKSQETHK